MNRGKLSIHYPKEIKEENLTKLQKLKESVHLIEYVMEDLIKHIDLGITFAINE